MSENKQPLAPLAAQHLLAPPDYYHQTGQAWEAPRDTPTVPLSQYLWILKRHRWKILGFVFVVVAATWVVSSRLTPIYESTSIIDIDRQMPTGVVGQESTRSALNDSDQFIATQMKLVQSDSVLRPVVDQFKLQDVTSGPVLGGIEDAEAPVTLRNLKITRPANTYLLLISYRSPDRHLAADVANAIAHSYVQHSYNIRIKSSASLSEFMEKQLEGLKAKMEQSSAALGAFEKEFAVINPEEKTSILSSRLLQLNADRTKAETDRIAKQAAWQSVQDGNQDAAAVSSQGEVLRKLAERLNEAEQKYADVQIHYGENHPEYKRAAGQLAEVQRQVQRAKVSIGKRVEVEYTEAVNREAMLQRSVADTKAEFDNLNARSFEYQNAKREADGDKKLYEELVRRIREAGINAGFQNSNIRIADNARPGKRPVFPELKLNLLIAFLLSTVLAIGAAILSDTLDNTIQDPDQVKVLLNIDVIGTLPQVKGWRGKSALALTAGGSQRAEGGSRKGSTDRAFTGFEEAIQTLRNSILLGTFGRPLKSLIFTSASPSEGKTTTAVHIALASAKMKHKTLLIDCDLRRPGVHRKFGLSPQTGLGTALQNGMNWKKELISLENLDLLPAVGGSRRTADLIGGSLQQILTEAESDYDLIVVDAPPLLGFPEPMQMAAVVDGVVLVAKAGETNRKALTAAISTLHRLRANLVGLVLNELTKDLSDGYNYYSYYSKYNQYYKPRE